MEKVPYFNPGENPVYIGGTMVPPKDTRDVYASLIPGYKPESSGSSSTSEPTYIVDVLMQKPASEIIAAIPSLAIEDLEKLGEAEQTGPARQEVLAAIAEHLLSQANKAVEEQASSSQSGQSQQPLETQTSLQDQQQAASQSQQAASQPAGESQQTNQDLQDLASAVSQPVDDAAPKTETAQEGVAQ